MCQYTPFTYACGHEKLKLSHPCNTTTPCSPDRSPHHEPTYGPGICPLLPCRLSFSSIPPPKIPLSAPSAPLPLTLPPAHPLPDNDTPFNLSPSARGDRELAWYRSLSTFHQTELINETRPYDANPSFWASVNVLGDTPPRLHDDATEMEIRDYEDEMRACQDAEVWRVEYWELNPAGMDGKALGNCLRTGVLGWDIVCADLVGTGKGGMGELIRLGCSPLKAKEGPMKVVCKRCWAGEGLCGKCGVWRAEREYWDEGPREERRVRRWRGWGGEDVGIVDVDGVADEPSQEEVQGEVEMMDQQDREPMHVHQVQNAADLDMYIEDLIMDGREVHVPDDFEIDFDL